MGIISNGFFQNIDYHAIIVSISDFLLTIGTIYFVLWFFGRLQKYSGHNISISIGINY
jgi:hypothetical protein